jgi:Protein of unknown function (DUF3667)
MDQQDHGTGGCLTCGASFEGNFCPNCGEKQVHAGDLKLSHLWHDFLHEFTHVDGKIWGTFRCLLLEPGRLTKDYWEGRRGLWLRPLRIYLIVAALVLILTPEASGPLGMRVWAQMGPTGPNVSIGTRPYDFAVKGVQVGKNPGASVAFYIEKELGIEDLAHLTEMIHTIYKVIQYLSLALFAAVSLWISRKVQPYYGAHLIFALHFYSFQLIVSGVLRLLSTNPVLPNTAGIFYLLFAMWRLVGGGQTSPRKYWMDWASLWRTMVLSSAMTFIELGLLSASGKMAMLLLKSGH